MKNRCTVITSSLVAIGTLMLSSAVSADPAVVNTPGFGGNNYRLPAFEAGSRLLFQGDSITDMNWGRRESDRNHYLGHSYVFLIAARLGVEMPEAQLDFYNRGNSGNKVADLRKRWQTDAIEMKPDILTILIGTNDVGIGFRHPDRKVTPAAFEADYRVILDASRKANPDLRLVLMDPFVLPTGPLKNEQAYQVRREATDKLREVVAKLAKEYEAVHVKTQDIFDAAADAVTPEQWMWDGVHPLPQGHELIARHWLQQVSARWPQAVHKRVDFQVDGRDCYVVVPGQPATENPWVWRARFPKYHPEADILLLEKGFHVAYMDTGGMLGSPRALKHWDAFYAFMTSEKGLAEKVALEAVSRGGLFAYRWAAQNPDKVACIYADTPVCDFKSWPLGQGSGLGNRKAWQNLLKEYGFTEEQALAYRENPIDVLAPIAKANIPLLHIISLNDRVVPPGENTFVLVERYRELGGRIEIIEVQEGPRANGHHFDHPNPKRVADFIIRHAHQVTAPESR